MTTDEALALHVLCTLDIAVLRRTGPRRYAFLGEAPAFYTALFAPDERGAPCTTPWEASPMLDFFLNEAEEFFASGAAGSLESGVWEEDGRTESDTALSAAATLFDDDQLLIIRLQRAQYAERRGILRKARVQLLENRELAHDLALFKAKSRIDGLTEIFNKTTFAELLQDEIKRSQLLGYALFLLILDIDDFKQVNDTYGHPAGDAVLQAMSALLKNTLRSDDIVARYGGEEFAVLIPQQNSLEQTAKVAEKIRKSIAAMHAPNMPRITVSIGCTAYIAGESPEQFIKRADDAMYEAKNSGKNAVCVYR
jgi:diguanylate cyclase (GGDEF)-like protein